MLVDPHKHPSFPMHLLEHGFIDKIRMPAAFVKEHKKMLAKTCLLKTDEGLCWEAKIVKEISHYFICQGNWARFVVHHKLELGDMLIFFLLDKSTFHVLPYTKKPFTNIRHFEELSSSEEEVENVEENIGIGPSRRCKKVKTEPNESSTHGTWSTESDDDSIEILDGTPTSNRGKTKVSDIVAHYVENLGLCLLGQSSKIIKRQEEDAEDDVTLDMYIKRKEIEKLIEGVASPSCTREGQTSGCESCKMHKQQSSILNDLRRIVMNKAKAIAYQREKANFKSKNPFFISFMHPSNISRSYLNIKLTFARKYIPENCSNIVLRVAGRGSWPITYYLGPVRAKISNGWTAFMRDNQLKLGDVCVFEVIKNTQVFMDVTIFPSAGSMSMQGTDGPDCN